VNTTKDQILALLPKLTAPELNEVASTAQALLDLAGALPLAQKEIAEDIGIHEVWEGFQSACLNDLGLGRCPPIEVMKSRWGNKVSDVFSGMRAYLDSYMPKATRNERRHIYKLMVISANEYLQVQGQFISYKTLFESLERVGVIMDHAFPGYAKNGMLKFLVRHRG